MIGLDTNILVRLFAEDDERQRDAAAALLDGLGEDDRAVVNVVVELVWVLARAYRFEQPQIAIALERLSRHPRVHLPERDLIREAVHRSRESGDDIADALIALLNRAHGCRTTLTFDRDAARRPDFELLAS
jgi:predicted nucleic-acid-binding protein